MSEPFEASLGEAVAALLPDSNPGSAEPLGQGHIHDTFRVGGEAGASYVLQRVNTRVFRDPDALDRNLVRVTDTLREARRSSRRPDSSRHTLHLVRASSGATQHRAEDGSAWRAFVFVDGSRALDGTPESPSQARSAAHAFGAFVADLDGLPPSELQETIPDFHDLAGRVRALERVYEGNTDGRASEVSEEVALTFRLAERLDPRNDPALPLRVVHNDCKLNNLLLDAASGEPLCVVDLDTVMAGHVWFDFGELVRTGACPGSEDARDPAQVRFDPALFRALAEGFVAGARGLFTPEEVASLALAGPRMALENAARFLTDHLEGDVYFPADRPSHNRDRAQIQLRRVEVMLGAENLLGEVVGSLRP